MAFSNPRRRAQATGSTEIEGIAASPKVASSLRKGATFHAPSSPVSTGSQLFATPSLPRGQSQMGDVVDANRRRIAMTLNEIDEALSLERLSLAPSPKEEQQQQSNLRDTSLPVPRGFLDLSDTESTTKERQRRVLRPRSARRTNNHASDSGIGSSLASSSVKDKPAGAAVDGTKKKTKRQGSATAITRSAASVNMDGLPSLGPKAVSRITEHTLGPLLEKPSLRAFEPIVLDVPRRIRSKEIICLRDLEKTLLFMAPDKAKTGIEYLDFTLTSIRCIQATVEYLSDREQVRPGDRPYTNGYFIDLKDQVLQYGRDLAAAKGDDSMDIDRTDEIRLHGGMAENGRPAELVRVRKDGSAVSMATGKPVDIGEGPVQFKRSLSEQREDDEEIMRSMARRKKNASPEELAPKRCREPGCTKEFKRPCDLTKHEKTHSRPWKCPFPTCKYHDFGWPTQKEMDRHVNDKHSDAPAMYECEFKPCPYKSKRESNCKQHMEKAHGWTYVRTKTNGGKKTQGKESPSEAQQTPPLANASTPSDAYSVPTPQDNNTGGVAHGMHNDFPFYQPEADWLANYGLPSENMEGMDLTLEDLSPAPSSSASYEQYAPYQNGSQFITDEDIYAAAARIPHQQLPSPTGTPEAAMLLNKMMPQMHYQLPQMQAPPHAKQMAHHLHLQQQQQQQQQQQHQHHAGMQAQAFHSVPQPQQQFQMPQTPAPHFSPRGQQNTMLYTPSDHVDEVYEDTLKGADFQLFPTDMSKNNVQGSFAGVPSADLGFSQTSQPEIFQQVDLSQLDYNDFNE